MLSVCDTHLCVSGFFFVRGCSFVPAPLAEGTLHCITLAHLSQRLAEQTYVGLYGLERARKLAEEVTMEAIEALQQIEGDTAVLASIAQSMLIREV